VRRVLASLILLSCRPAAPAVVDDAYAAALTSWRDARAAELQGEQGWLALAGLYWLAEGEHRLGADEAADMVFPAGAPAVVGAVTRRGGAVTLRLAPGVEATLGGAAVDEVALRPDVDRVRIGGRFVLLAIARGERLGLRLYDTAAPARRAFAGVDAFPVDPAWRVRARFEPYDPPRAVEHPTVVGTTRAEVPGVAVFRAGGRELRLTPILERGAHGPELLFVFRDGTSGAETYPGGRFLVADLPRDGALELDFNRAHNPPCAFTAYATCPLPRPENHLPLRVEAGEKAPADAHAP
jgi:hypothetical protein